VGFGDAQEATTVRAIAATTLVDNAATDSFDIQPILLLLPRVGPAANERFGVPGQKIGKHTD
jgi:hypothetical protein